MDGSVVQRRSRGRSEKTQTCQNVHQESTNRDRTLYSYSWSTFSRFTYRLRVHRRHQQQRQGNHSSKWIECNQEQKRSRRYILRTKKVRGRSCRTKPLRITIYNQIRHPKIKEKKENKFSSLRSEQFYPSQSGYKTYRRR